MSYRYEEPWGLCTLCLRTPRWCTCNDAPQSEPAPKDWAVTYVSSALGRRVYTGAMTHKNAEGWAALLRRGRCGRGARILRVLPLVRCETPRVPIYHDGPMRPATELLEVK
jgi:hypothetical protein